MKRLAVITGSAGGIGKATVRVFSEKGWEVIGLDRNPGDTHLEGVESERVDVSSPDEVERFFNSLGSTRESLDALVNNAGIQINKPLIETEPSEWNSVQDSNLRSIYLTGRHAYRLLRAGKGSVVNISSVHALATSINVAAYAASKGGILALTRAMALEFGPDDIRVNAVLPGAVDTQMLRDGLSRGHLEGTSIEERLEQLSKKTVLGRVGQPHEIARAIYFLCDGAQSSFVTGQALVVDGGAMARLSTE